ncbi:uncharacterized protein METZ01_LOCUS489801, partial [marine metagenome]
TWCSTHPAGNAHRQSLTGDSANVPTSTKSAGKRPNGSPRVWTSASWSS